MSLDAKAGAPATITVDSHLLGPTEIDPDSTFTFRQGLLGFPEARRFALIAAPRQGLYWLQSVEHEALTFLLVDPFPLVDGFGLDLDRAELRKLEADGRSELAVLAVVTLPREAGASPTANFHGPVVLNFSSRTGRQVVVPDSPWGTRHPVDLDRCERLAS